MTDGKKTDVPDDSVPAEPPKLAKPNLKDTTPGTPSPAMLKVASGEHPVGPAYANTVISKGQQPNPMDFAKTQVSASNPVLARLQAEERAAKERLVAERQLAESNAAQKASNERLVADRLATGPRLPVQLPASPAVAAPRALDPSALQTDPMRGVSQRPQPLRQPLASRPLPPPVATPVASKAADVITDPMPRTGVPPSAISSSTVSQRSPAAPQVPKTDPMQQPDVLAAIERVSRVAIPPPPPLAPRAAAAPISRPLPPAPVERTEISPLPLAARPRPALVVPPSFMELPPVKDRPALGDPVSAVGFPADRTEVGRSVQAGPPTPAVRPAAPVVNASTDAPRSVARAAENRTELARPIQSGAPFANASDLPGVALPDRNEVVRAAPIPTSVHREAPRSVPPAAPLPGVAIPASMNRPDTRATQAAVPFLPDPVRVDPMRATQAGAPFPASAPPGVMPRAPAGPTIDAAPTVRSPQGPQVTPTPARQVRQQDLTPIPPKEPFLAPAVTAPAPPPRPAQLAPPSFMDLPPAMEKPRRAGPDLATTQPGIPGPYSRPRPPPSEPAFVAPEPAATTSSDDALGSDQVLATPASLWRRAFSWVFDLAVICGLVGGLLFLAVSVTTGKPVPNNLHGIDAFFFKLHPIAAPMLGLTLLLAVLYTTMGAFLLRGRTFGRLLFGIRLVDSSGKSPGVVRSLLRALFAIVSFAFFLAGFWLALFDRRGQTLHDKLTRTFVVRPV